MFDVYFVNCLLACSLAFWGGYALASRKWKIIITNMIYQAQQAQAALHKKLSSVQSDLKLH